MSVRSANILKQVRPVMNLHLGGEGGTARPSSTRERKRSDHMNETSWKHTIGYELVQLAEVFLIVVLFFLMFATYRMMLLDAFDSKYFLYSTALVNAAVISKIIA